MAGGGYDMTSIIILTYNQLEYTKQCLKSVWCNTDRPHEIIVIDNASTDGTVEWLKMVYDNGYIDELIINETNKGVPAAWNQGIACTSDKADYYLFLNNDTIVPKEWLSGLIRQANLAEYRVGAVGPVSNYVSGPQLRPATYSLDEFESFASSWAEGHKNHIAFWRLVGFCLLIPAVIVCDVGLFDEDFGRGNFEDDDYCQRIIKAGYQNVICESVYVHHFGSKSWEPGALDEQLKKNWVLFNEKHPGAYK